jgi:hypothetical protein
MDAAHDEGGRMLGNRWNIFMTPFGNWHAEQASSAASAKIPSMWSTL